MANEPSAHKTRQQWWKEARVFLVVFAKHWEAWVAIILSGATASILQWQGGFTTIPGWALWMVAMFGVMVAAFKTWYDQKRISEAKEFELQEQKTSHAIIIADQKDKIARLQTQLDDREQRKANGVRLGDYKKALIGRIAEIRELGSGEFCKQYTENYRKGVLDPDSQQKVNSIKDFLRDVIGGSSEADFSDTRNTKWTPIKFSNVEGMALAAEMLEYDARLKYWQSVIDRLNFYANELTEISKTHQHL